MKRIIVVLAAFILLSVSCCFAGSDSSVTGTYVNKTDKEYLTLNPDGSLYLKLRKTPPDPNDPFMNLSGKYRMTGEEITMELEGGGEASGTIVGNTFVDNEGKRWEKEGSSQASKMNQSIPKGSRIRQ